MSESKTITVAKYLIHLANNYGDKISNLKLQKLMYYAQAWYLAGLDKPISEPLFSDEIEAWVLGPAIRSVYTYFKKFGSDSIQIDTKEENFDSLSVEEIELLDEVYVKYGQFSASQLVQITHSEKPWQNTRNGLNMTTHSERCISLQEIKDYYRGLLSH